MRYFTTDRDCHHFNKVDQQLLLTGNGDLTPKEIYVIAYLTCHKQGYRISTSQIAEDSGWSRRKVQKIIKSLEEKGYLYRNRENWDPQTGPEFLLAERPRLLRQVLDSENLFPPEEPQSEEETTSQEKPPEDEPSEEKKTEKRSSGQPKIPDELLRISTVVRRQWHKIRAKKQKPARFVRAPVRQPTPPEEMLPGLWQLSIGRGYGIEIGVPNTAYPRWPTLFGRRVCAVTQGGGHFLSTGVRTIVRPRNASADTAETVRTIVRPGANYSSTPVRTIVRPPLRLRLRTKTKTKTTASLLQRSRLSNVREQRARALAEVNSNSNASYRQTPPDRDRSHGRLFVKMFGEKSGRPYHGIRLYSKMDNDWHFRPTLHEHEEGSLSIYWLRADAEPGVPIPTPRSETPAITERPLAEGAEPKASHEVPARFEDVGVRCGPGQPHPTGERPTGRRLRSGAGFEALLGHAEISIRRGPHPWPDHLIGEEPELSFAGHRPEEQLPGIVQASEVVYSTEFLEDAIHAIFEEPFEEDPRPTDPSPEDRRRAEEFGIPPRNVMVLRQIAEVTIDPHGPSFDYENTYQSPGRDPWAIRMYSALAFPGIGLPAAAKDYLDKKVAQACPTSPAAWAKTLFKGLQREWDPAYVKNFARAYRHWMGIERDPGRSLPPGGRRSSQGEITRGNGIDLSEGDPKELIPPDNLSESERSER